MFTTDSLRVDANVFSLSSCSVIAGLASTRLELSRSKSTLKNLKNYGIGVLRIYMTHFYTKSDSLVGGLKEGSRLSSIE